LVETGMSPLTTRYKFESKYFGKSSASNELVAGRSSETLTQTVFPAAIAPAWDRLSDTQRPKKRTRLRTRGLIRSIMG